MRQLGFYVCQMRKIKLRYCPQGGSSRGIREFIENDIVEFARQHPSIVIEAMPRRAKHPYVSGFYLNGNIKRIGVKNLGAEEIGKHVRLLRDNSGRPNAKLKTWTFADSPTVQGTWSPFTNSDARHVPDALARPAAGKP